MTLPGDDGHEEEASDALTPGVEGMETPEQAPAQEDKEETITSEPHAQESSTTVLPDRIDWLLPEQSDKHDTDGRTGVLSTRTEVHAIVIGGTVGAHWALTGDMQLLNDIVGIGIAGDRARQAQKIPEKYQDQAKEEFPYFAAGLLLGFGAARSDLITGVGV